MTICKPRRGKAGPSWDLHRSESEEGLIKVATLIRSDPSNAHDGWEVRGGAHRHARCGAPFSLEKPRRSLGGRGSLLLIVRTQEGLGQRAILWPYTTMIIQDYPSLGLISQDLCLVKDPQIAPIHYFQYTKTHLMLLAPAI